MHLWSWELLNFIIVANMPWHRCPVSFLLVCDMLRFFSVSDTVNKHHHIAMGVILLSFTKGFVFDDTWEIIVHDIAFEINLEAEATTRENGLIPSLEVVATHCMLGCGLKTTGRLARDALIRCAGVGANDMVAQIMIDRETLPIVPTLDCLDPSIVKSLLLVCMTNIRVEFHAYDEASESALRKVNTLVESLLTRNEFKDIVIAVLVEAALSTVAYSDLILRGFNGVDKRSKLLRVAGQRFPSIDDFAIDVIRKQKIAFNAELCVKLILPLDIFPTVRHLSMTESTEFDDDTYSLLSHDFWRSDSCLALADFLHMYILTKLSLGRNLEDTGNQVFDSYALRLSVFVNFVSSRTACVDSFLQNEDMETKCGTFLKTYGKDCIQQEHLFRSTLNQIINDISLKEGHVRPLTLVCTRLWVVLVGVSHASTMDSLGYGSDFMCMSAGCSVPLEIFRILACTLDTCQDWIERDSSSAVFKVILSMTTSIYCFYNCV